MNDETTIITAFYKLDLDKESTQSYKSNRSLQTYLDFFSFNAGLKNKFVIYCNDSHVARQIYDIRARHNLESQTIIIEKPLESFAHKDLDSIKKVFREYNQTEQRFDTIHPPHTSPMYDYLMYCKSFFVLDSMQNEKSKDFIDSNLLWLDFGFNLGGGTFLDSSDFDFTLIPQRNMSYNDELLQQIKQKQGIEEKQITGLIDSKLNMFMLGRFDRRPLPLILINGTQNFIIGGLIYGNHHAWREFNMLMQKALKAFVGFNIIDDDQKMYIWCIRNFPELFNIVAIDDWFNSLFYFIPESKRKSIKVKKASIFGGKVVALESNKANKSRILKMIKQWLRKL